MSEQFITFHTFFDEEVAIDFAEKFKSSGIDFTIVKTPAILDAQIIGASSDPGIEIKIAQQNFARAHQFLENYYKAQIADVDNSYYLFSFSNDELFEIIRKPDEWGYFDYQLAQRLLKERDFPVDESALTDLKSKREEYLALPKKSNLLLSVVGWFFVLAAVLYLLSPKLALSDVSFLTILFSFFIGKHIYFSKKVLPSGQSVFSYTEASRKNAGLLIIFSIIVFVACLSKILIAIISD